MAVKKIVAGMMGTLAVCAMAFGFYVYYFTEPVGEVEPEIVECYYGFNETSQSCELPPVYEDDCYEEYNEETGEWDEYCVAASGDAGYATAYTTDGRDPEFKLPGTNIVYPVPVWASHVLLGAVVLKTGGGALSIIGKLFRRKPKGPMLGGK